MNPFDIPHDPHSNPFFPVHLFPIGIARPGHAHITLLPSLYNIIPTPTKMAQSGYDPDRFLGTDHQSFHCLICLNVAKDPYECHGCGKMVCMVCITGWASKNPQFKCPNRCGNNDIRPVASKALMRMYKDLKIKCSSPTCNKVITLSDLASHELGCLVAKCWNYEVCVKPANKEIKNGGGRPCCSEVCAVIAVIKEKIGDKKGVYDALGAYMKLVKVAGGQGKVGGGSQGQINYPPGPNIPYPYPQPSGNVALAWDPSKTGGGISITQNGAQCFLKEQSYLFRTTLTTQGFTSGVHYWQIQADSRTENELKIGVTTNKDFDYNSAFCDHPFGFAYYGLGQLRHNSNASGPSYGKKFKKEGFLGVCLNMNTGVLAFSLNGEYMGVAYKDPKLTSGPIFPAVALLHCAGCKIRSGLAVPSYFKD